MERAKFDVWPAVALMALLVTLLAVNVFVVPYPVDNDLDEIGWIAAHQTLSRPESLVNQNYPFAYPLLLSLLIPVFGSLLTAAFVTSSIAATLWAWLVYRLTRTLGQATVGTAMAAAATAVIMLIPLAVSEFADNITTALFLAGLSALVARPQSLRAVGVFGLCTGVCFLFRFHFMLLAVIAPVAMLWVYDAPARWRRAAGVFVAAFVVGALPLLALNVWVRGQPLHTGLTPYMVGWSAADGFDWDDFLNTYNHWPLSRLVREEPARLLRLLYVHAQFLLQRPEVHTGAVLVPLALVWALPKPNRRLGACLATIMVLYLGLIVWPSQFSTRGAAPVTCLLCILSFPVLARVAQELPVNLRLGPLAIAPVVWWGTAIVVLFVGINNPFRPLLVKRHDQEWNRAVIAALHDHGGGVGARIFSSDWQPYPLDDPRFVTYHNYGGYMLLDPLYNATLPRPNARSAREWQAFFDAQQIEFVIARPAPKIQAFLDGHDPGQWQEIHADERAVVYKRLTALTTVDRAPSPAGR